MPSDADFLAAIVATQEDRAVRLVYADWLEDHDDPRAELIRIEEELRTLPVFADRYWALKSRRNDLRAGAAPDWLAALSYDGGYEPTFRVIPAGWRERWRLIREFHERWHGEALPDVGGECAAVASLEQSAGRRLPASVREWATFQRDIATGPAPCRDGEFVASRLDERAALVVFEEMFPPNRCVYYAVLESDLHLDDPPLYCFLDEPDEFPLAAGTVSGQVLLSLLGDIEGASGFRANVTPATVAELTALLGPAQTIEGTYIFEADNLLVRGHDRHLWVDYQVHPAPESIPPLLWSYAATRAHHYGIFRERGGTRPEDIPF